MKNVIKINLGLVAHIISTIIYMILVNYIIQSETIGMAGRAGIVIMYIAAQCFTALICYDCEFYKKYTK